MKLADLHLKLATGHVVLLSRQVDSKQMPTIVNQAPVGTNDFTIRPGAVVLPYGYVEGRYERDGSQLYVNRGFGTAGPSARVGSPPEVTRVVLVSG